MKTVAFVVLPGPGLSSDSYLTAANMVPPLWQWLLPFERRLVDTLLRQPAFHRAVEQVHKNLHRIRHGTPPEEMGGTKLDQPGRKPVKHFFELFSEELKNGLKSGKKG